MRATGNKAQVISNGKNNLNREITITITTILCVSEFD